MKEKNIIKLIVLSLVLSGYSFAQDSTKVQKVKEPEKQNNRKHQNFVDADGDGYNDNAPDHDGDGIPNGLDPDYIKLNKRKNDESLEYVDSNGDGINDNLQFNGKGRRKRFNKAGLNNQLLPQNSNSNKTIEKGRNKNSKGKG